MLVPNFKRKIHSSNKMCGTCTQMSNNDDINCVMFSLFSTIKAVHILVNVILDDGAFMFSEENLGASVVKMDSRQHTGMIMTRSNNSTVKY